MTKWSALVLAALLSAPLRATPQQLDWQSGGKPSAAASADPAIEAALHDILPERLRQTVVTLVGFGNRNTLGGVTVGSTEEGAGSTGVKAAANWIEQELRRYSAACGGCLEIKRDTFTEQPQSRIPKPTVITNIYAILRGSDPAQAARMHLVTGHYDSRNTDVEDASAPAPGANDDASGVAVSLECARVLSRHKWPCTLIFAAVAGEEQGLNGSRHLAQLAKGEGWQLETVLNNDIVGGDTTPGDTRQNKSIVRVFSEGIPVTADPQQTRRLINLGAESDSASRELARAVAAVARTYTGLHPTLIFRRDRYLRGGDHTSFNAEGFPAIRFTEWRENFDHQHQNLRTENGVIYGDLIRFVDFDYVAKVARLNAAVLAVSASAPAPPRNVRITTTSLDNNSTLQWESAASAPAGTRFEVLWRESAAADWQYASVATPAFTLTVPVSKDNVIFGVRALDAAGHRSAAVTPQ